MREDILKEIVCQQEIDKNFLEQYEVELQSLKLKIKYYQGKFDAANEIIGMLSKQEPQQ